MPLIRRAWLALALGALAATLAAPPARAAGDLSRQEPLHHRITLGTAQGEHRFAPDTLVFETGRLHVLRIVNANPKADYYFHSAGFADAIYSRKLVALGSDGQPLAEFYGPVRRLEVKAGQSVEWWFVPVRSGRFDDLMSTRSHSEAGMRGVIELR